MPDTDIWRYLLLVIAAALGGAVNSVAGGGTLITFPALVGLGLPPIVANATSTVALWPGMVASWWGYRAQLAGMRRWVIGFAIPSVLGGVAGALLLLVTPADRFENLVPWLVLVATALFISQRAIVAAIGRSSRTAESAGDAHRPSAGALFVQAAIAIYGGYFGAAIGILMLATLGLSGLNDIHRMNGLKAWGALCINVMAASTFVVSGLVDWRLAIAMAAGATAGGYGGARFAQKLPQPFIRGIITVIGLASGVWLLVR